MRLPKRPNTPEIHGWVLWCPLDEERGRIRARKLTSRKAWRLYAYIHRWATWVEETEKAMGLRKRRRTKR